MRLVARFALALSALAAVSSSALAAEPPADGVRVDVPVMLKEAKVVYNMDHGSAMVGDQPVGLTYMALMVKRFKEDHTQWRIAAVFHNSMAYLLLNDGAYNKVRKTSHGNPYKEQIATLVAEGVEIEECAVSMRNNGWTNADLLPGVKVTTGAVGRIVQLVQEGYVQVEP